MKSRAIAFSLLLIAAILGAFEAGRGTVKAQTANRAMPPGMSVTGGPQASYADVVDVVAPAVVTIRADRRVHAPQQFPYLDDPFLRQFFGGGGPNGRPRGQNRTEVERALGSGVIVQADGHIITNHHVVDGADQIKVELSDNRIFPAKLVGSDAPSDLAVLKIDATKMPVLPLGDSDRVRVGDICLAVGNPLGIGETVTSGIISAKGRATGPSDGSFEDFLQTDAAINQGNSGGALVNTRGELIGINSQILTPSGGNIGIGFAIPSNMARNVMDQLLHGGQVHRGMLGVGIQAITPELATSMNLKDTHGVLVNSVEPNSPADKAGIHSGDVITSLNGAAVTDPNSLRNRVAGAAPGSQVSVGIVRDGRPQQVQVKLAELPAQKESSSNEGAQPNGENGPQLGLGVEPLTPDEASQLGLKNGSHGALVTTVDPSGPAAEAGIRTDDVIQEVNHQAVRSGAEIRAALQKSGKGPALLLVNRGGHTVFIAVSPAGR
jgi:Do/DeqQ family serine protease